MVIETYEKNIMTNKLKVDQNRINQIKNKLNSRSLGILQENQMLISASNIASKLLFIDQRLPSSGLPTTKQNF